MSNGGASIGFPAASAATTTATPGVSVHLSDTISFAQGRGLKHTPVSDYSVAGNASDGYAGAISKTTDGGKPVMILQRTFLD